MDTIFATLSTGLPVLLLQFALALALLALAAAAYVAITPFHELALIRAGNAAAGLVFAGTLVALAIPLAATLATSLVTLDILVWGVIAALIQLAAFAAATALLRGLREQIEGGNVAAASALVGVQIAVAVINAGAMAG